MGTNHCVQAFLTVLCRRARHGDHGARGFRRDIPFLRLLVGSKAGEVVDFIVMSHGAPPTGENELRECTMTVLWPDQRGYRCLGSNSTRRHFTKPSTRSAVNAG